MPFISFDEPKVSGFVDFDAPEPPAEPRGILRAAGDTAVQFGKGTGILGTLAGGLKGTVRAVGGAVDVVQGDNEGLGASVREQQAERKDPRLEAFMSEIAAWKKGQDDAGTKPDWIDTAKALGSAAWNNPAGAGLMIAEQLPNSAVSMGAGYGGMKAGGILGGVVAGPPGAAAGAVIGGIAGLFAANTTLETGNKAIEARQAGPLSDEQRMDVMGEGARKGAVITGIDALTLGATNVIGKATTRAVESATVKTLADAGINIADKAAVLAARQNPTIVTAVQAAQKTAMDATTTLGQRAMRTGGQAALETFGESAGEYLGEYAASGELDKMEALIEAFSSAGTSAAEIALTKTWGGKATEAAMWGDAPKADVKPAARAKLMGMGARPATPDDILAAPDADTAIAAFTASLTGTDMGGILGQANPLIAPAREMQAQAAADEADLADLAQSESRDLNTLRAQLDQESRKQSELDALQATGTGQYGIRPEERAAVEQAATVEAPTAMQLAMQRAKAAVIPNEGQPLPMTAPKPAAPTPPASSDNIASGAVTAPIQRQPDILPADISRNDGKPFQTESGARLKQRYSGGIDGSDIIAVEGGFVVRPKAAQADAVPTATDASAQLQPTAGSAVAQTEPAQPIDQPLTQESPSAQTDQAQQVTPERQEPAAGTAPVIEASPAGQPTEGSTVPAKAQDQRLIPVSKRQPAEPDDLTEDETTAEFERLYQADIKADIRRRLGMEPPAKEARATASPFRTFLRHYGISPQHASDITGERGIRANNRLPATFRRNGLALDELALRAVEDGYLTQADLDSDADNGGTNKLMEMIQAEIRGERQETTREASDSAEAQMERVRQAELEGVADALGIPYPSDIDPMALASMVARVQRALDASREPKGSTKGDRVRLNAIAAAQRIETKRQKYERELEEFAKASIREQNAFLEVLMDDEGAPVVNRLADQQADDAWNELLGAWEDQNGQTETPAEPPTRQAGTPDGAGAAQRPGDAQEGDSSQQRRSTEGEAQGPVDLFGEAPNASQQAAEDLRKKQEAKEQAQRNAAPASSEFALGMVDQKTGDEVAPGQSEIGADAAPAERFAAGKALTKEQRKSVLKTLADVYKAKGAPREQKGVGQDGNERYGYVYSPELFEKSDITGSMVRYHVTLPDGRIAHPSELFPDYTQADIDAAIAQSEGNERQEAESQARWAAQAEQFSKDSAGESDADWRRRNNGPNALQDWRTGQKFTLIPMEKGGRFYSVRSDDAALIARLERAGWKRTDAAPAPAAPTTQASEILDAANVTGKATAPLESDSSAQPSDAARAKEDLKSALSDLGNILTKGQRSNLMPEEEQKIMPVLVRVFDAAFRLGYANFKDAAKYALERIRETLGADVADSLTNRDMQDAHRASAAVRSNENDNRTAVVVGAKPGEFKWDFTAPTAPPPFALHPSAFPRLEKIGEATHTILKSSGFKKLVDDMFGVKGLEVAPLHGSWEGKPEPSFGLYAPGLTFEQSDDMSKMLGMMLAQDATVVTQPTLEEADDEIPVVYIGSTKKLTDSQLASVVKSAKELGVDYSTSLDGKAVKFLHFGDADGLEKLFSDAAKIAADAGLGKPQKFYARSSLNESSTYTQERGGGAGGQAWHRDTPEGPSDLFRRAVDHVLVPYAKAVAAEGYTFSVQRYAERFGLSPAQQRVVSEALAPRNGAGKATSAIMRLTDEQARRALMIPEKKANVSHVLMGLQNSSAQQGLIEPGDYSDKASKLIAQALTDEVLYHVNEHGGKSAIGWYDRALKAAKKAYMSVFPEISTDKNKSMLFDALLGIASQGNDVFSNSLFAGRMYVLLENGKTIPEAVKLLRGSFGGETRAIENNYLKLHELLERNGYDTMRAFFNKKATVGEINAILRSDTSLHYDGKPLQVDGAARQTVTGWSVFGPKIGSFINNLHGDYSTLTADLWFSRTWNRILGYSFVHAPALEADQYQKFIKALVAESSYHAGTLSATEPKNYNKKGEPIYYEFGKDAVGMDDASILEVIDNPEAALALATKLEAKFRKGGYKEKSDLLRAAKVWVENRNTTVALPRTDNERTFQQETAERTQKMLKAKGLDISIADIQAALWYHEKDLFKKLGVSTKHSEAADYEDAAKKLVSTMAEGKLFWNEADERKVLDDTSIVYKRGAEPQDNAGGTTAFARTEPTLDVSDPRTGISTALLELGKSDDLYQYPRSAASSLEDIAADKGGIEVGPVDRDTEDENLWIIANTTPRDGPTTKSWMMKTPGGQYATLTRKGDEVYINAAGLEEGGGGSAVYDLAANFALNNGLVFVGDPNGLSTSALRRRLENMLSSAVKYGTTDHLAPHPKQITGSKLAKVPPLKWTPGDTLGNIRSMVDVSVAATQASNPISTANVRYDIATQSFRDGEDNRLDDAGLSDLLRFEKRAPGAGTGGVSTVQRNALFQSLLQSEGARRALLESVRGQQDDAGPGVGGLKRSFYARNNQGNRGVHIDDANAVVAAVREALPTAPTIHIMESLGQAPAELRKFIKAAGAENDVDAAYHNGEIYVFPANIPSIERMQFVLAHHEIRHHGLAAMLGPRKNAVMLKIHESNPKIRALASEQVRKGYAKSRILATEEALADMPAEDLVQLNGWDKVVAAVREWLRGAAARLRRAGLSGIADAIDAKTWTDKDVAALIARAEGVSRGGSARYASEGTVFADDGALARTGDQTSTEDTLFARSAVTGQTARQHTPRQLRAMKNVGFQVEIPTLKERAQALWKDAGKKMAQGIVDQFAPVKDLDKDAYALMRLSKGASGAFESFLHGGKLKLTDNVYDFDETNKGGVVDKLLIPLQGEHHDFMRWVAANRAERLAGEGKENLFSAQDIIDLKTLAEGTLPFDYKIQTGPAAGRVTRDRATAYADSLRVFNGFNKNILDMAEQSGLIDPESRKLWEHEFYVPFYRVADESEGGIRGANIKGGVVRQAAFKQLKGGKNALNADLLDNTLMNWAHLLDASAKNRAAKATIEAAERMGVAAPGNQSTLAQMATSINNKHGVVWFMDGGQKRYSLVDDPFLMTAITSLEYAGMRNPVMNAMSTFKHALTVGVTASPFFKIRNLIRDSVQVLGTSTINPNPLTNVGNGWKLTDPKSDEYFRLLAGGGTIHFGTMLEGSEAKRVQALVESGVDDATILGDQNKVKQFYRRYIEPGITAYNELGNRGEAINRASLYDQLRKQGMSHADASLQARDLMDFSMQGTFTTIRFLTQVVPFLNARLQGLYKLGRGAKEDPARFSVVVGAVTLMSLALLAAYSDDEEWKKREEWDRNNFFWFKFGGIAFRIPKPFEIGAISTLAERGFELAFDKEMTATRFRKQVMTLLGDNLSMNPVPQLIKPIIDVYSNKDSFSGRPIESMSMERLKSDYRFTDRTSMTARGLSTSMNAVTGLVGSESLSPVQIDHMLRGYFGWLGSFVVGAGDVVMRPASGQPTRAAPDYWKTITGGMAADLRDAPSRYVSQMYEQANEIERAYGTWRALQKEGKREEAAEFAADNRDLLSKYRQVGNVKRQESRLNERIRMIERSNMDATTKRELIRSIQIQKDRVARAVAA